MATSKEKLLVVTFTSFLLVSMLVGVQFVTVARANPTWLFIHTISPENMTYSTNEVPLIFEFKEYPQFNETASWMGYSLDNQEPITVTGNVTLLGLTAGSHSIIVYANDSFRIMEHSRTVNFTVISKATLSPSSSKITSGPQDIDYVFPFGYVFRNIELTAVVVGLVLVIVGSWIYLKKLRK
jgi:hypothetical protein